MTLTTGLKMLEVMTSKPELNEVFWSSRYRDGLTGWDLGAVSTPLKEYIDQLKNKKLKILIPGAGNSYEAEYLFKSGFSNVYIADISNEPLKNFRQRVPDFPKEHILHTDFFKIEQHFDLILEQTFFCALPVEKRPLYARKLSELLSKNGKLAGVLFSFELTENGPPFGGSREEYLKYFQKYFEIEVLEECYNSIKPRQGNELFIKFRKK